MNSIKLFGNKKGVFGLDAVQQAAIAFVILAIVLSVGATLVSEQQSDTTAASYAYNASENGLKAIDKLAGKQTLFATVIVLVLIIGVVMMLRRR